MSSSFISSYLSFYNLLSSSLWSYILIENIFYVFIQKAFPIPPHQVLIYTQVFNTTIEILHSIFGLVRTPIPTLLLQSFARLIILIGIVVYIPQSPAIYNIYTFSGLIFAWSITEIIRYSYYVFKNSSILKYLRYTTFIILYPIGLTSESWTVFHSYEYTSGFYYYFLKYAIVLYLPGFLSLYSYMFKQRAKVLH
ncbi:unnamed protein product [Candida verbasci]|uniref:Very-long-chain (3R)-3-hydroxyacyl-CoA dehydratase n=1 Tax=Candida verbasci TaxID=1227364 RepID=A0A9W4U1G9_9ASCO|nr:unnamed protein product [Candida verbasci]